MSNRGFQELERGLPQADERPARVKSLLRQWASFAMLWVLTLSMLLVLNTCGLPLYFAALPFLAQDLVVGVWNAVVYAHTAE